MTNLEHTSLDQQLAELSRDVAPPAHVWHVIGSRIRRTQRNAWPLGVAAAAACALVASALTWAVLHGRTAGTIAPLVLAARAPSFNEPLDPGYTATRTSLEATFRERLALLDPKTRAQIESSLTVIRQAHEDIRKALATQPANPVLEQLFESTWHDEFDLYDRVVRTTQPTLART